MLIGYMMHQEAWPLGAQVRINPCLYMLRHHSLPTWVSSLKKLSMISPWVVSLRVLSFVLEHKPLSSPTWNSLLASSQFLLLRQPMGPLGYPYYPCHPCLSPRFASSLGCPVVNSNTKVRCTCLYHITSLLQIPLSEEKPKSLQSPTRPSIRFPITP